MLLIRKADQNEKKGRTSKMTEPNRNIVPGDDPGDQQPPARRAAAAPERPVAAAAPARPVARAGTPYDGFHPGSL
jgi:hypothetical protein